MVLLSSIVLYAANSLVKFFFTSIHISLFGIRNKIEMHNLLLMLFNDIQSSKVLLLIPPAYDVNIAFVLLPNML